MPSVTEEELLLPLHPAIKSAINTMTKKGITLRIPGFPSKIEFPLVYHTGSALKHHADTTLLYEWLFYYFDNRLPSPFFYKKRVYVLSMGSVLFGDEESEIGVVSRLLCWGT